MYTVQKNINTSLYYITGLLNDKKEYKIIIKTDSYTQTFSIYSQEYIENKGYNEKSIEEEFNIEGIQYIQKNDNNQYKTNNITDKIMAQYYLYDYGEKVSRNIENAYKILDEEYKNKRYPTFEKYKEYIEQSNKNYRLLELKAYTIEKYNNYTKFICKDQYGDIYIFKDVGIMEYTLMLDNYTIENNEFNEKYNKVENAQKAKINIDKFFNMINMKDYESAYKLLDEEFKQKNFSTIEKFEAYIKAKTFNHNKIIYNTYNDEMSPIYIYNITLKDITNEQSKEYNYQIIVKLIEDTNFSISINLN